jgi:hypothetical protein
MISPFEDRLRDELVRATTRRRERRTPMVLTGLVVAAVAVVAAVLSSAVLSTDPASADVEVTQENGRVIVRLTDLENSPDAVEAATERAGLDVSVEGVPTGPSHVGRFVGDFATDANAVDVEKLDADGVTYMAFSLPEGWPGALTIHLGQPAREGEAYRIASDAYAPGEPLACSDTLGKSLSTVVDLLDGLDVVVQAFDSQQQPSAPMSLEAAIDDGLGEEAITGATATSTATVLIDVGRVVPPREYPRC